jgi:hypothetical protein
LTTRPTKAGCKQQHEDDDGDGVTLLLLMLLLVFPHNNKPEALGFGVFAFHLATAADTATNKAA